MFVLSNATNTSSPHPRGESAARYLPPEGECPHVLRAHPLKFKELSSAWGFGLAWFNLACPFIRYVFVHACDASGCLFECRT